MLSVVREVKTVTAWQEASGTQTQKVTVGAGHSATADFTFKAK
jgi:hypothetical protein